MEFIDVPYLYKTLQAFDNSLSTEVQFIPSGEKLIQLLHLTAEYLKTLTHSDGYIYYSLDESLGELYICPVGKSNKECFVNRYAWDVETGRTIAIHAFKNMTPIVVDANKSVDLNFPDLQALPCLHPRYILSIPLMNFQKRCFGVVEYYRNDGRQYNGVDVKLCQFLLNNCAEAFKQNESAVFFTKYNEHQFSLQEILEMYAFSDENRGSYTFLQEVVTMAQDCTGAMATALFIKHQDKLCEIATTDDTVSFMENNKEGGVGTILRSIIDTNFDISLMHHNIHGVIKIWNKVGFARFLVIDEHILEAFGKMCTIWCIIEYMSGYLKKQKTLNDNIMDLIKVQLQNAGDYNKKLHILTPTDPSMLNSWCYDVPMNAGVKRLSSDVVVMIMRIKGNLAIEEEALRDFVVMVEQCHSPSVEKEAFWHSVMCAQGLYRLLESCKNVTNDLEALAMMIALLGHNITIRDEPTHVSSIFGRYNDFAPELIRFEILLFLINETKLIEQLSESDQSHLLNLCKNFLIDMNLSSFKKNSEKFGLYMKQNPDKRLDCARDLKLRGLILAILPGLGEVIGHFRSEEFRSMFPHFLFFQQLEASKLTCLDMVMAIRPL